VFKRRLAVTVTAALLFASTLARADGPGTYRSRLIDRGLPDAPQSAIDAYTAGYASILRAEHAENLVAASSSERDRAAARKEASRAYVAALDSFAIAVRIDASMHEAHTYMGYANRKLGRYEPALQAYERALQIEPDLSRAIQYQGEAFLGLNRLDEARFNYLRLYALDRPQADKLLLAMQAWVEAKRSKPPKAVDFDGFAAWVAERLVSTQVDASRGRW
jgi:tetratricopeptide (TPR) repeat protein